MSVGIEVERYRRARFAQIAGERVHVLPKDGTVVIRPIDRLIVIELNCNHVAAIGRLAIFQ
jgi:hypothetical protein